MNGIEKITERIRRDAQGEIDALLLEAEKAAEAVREDARAQAAERIAAGRRQNEDAAREQESRLISAAEMEARQRVLAAKQQELEEVFRQAEQRLLSLPEGELIELLAAFVAREGETGQEELLFSEELRDRIGAQVTARANALRSGAAYTLAKETRETDGVILRHGRVESNGGIAIALRERRQSMAAELAELLFA